VNAAVAETEQIAIVSGPGSDAPFTCFFFFLLEGLRERG